MSADYHLNFRISVKTKGLSLVRLDPAHQALIDRILLLNKDGLNTRKIADHLNNRGVTSWGGKRFYPELVFGVIRKARILSMRKPVSQTIFVEFSAKGYSEITTTVTQKIIHYVEMVLKL